MGANLAVWENIEYENLNFTGNSRHPILMYPVYLDGHLKDARRIVLDCVKSPFSPPPLPPSLSQMQANKRKNKKMRNE